MTAWTGRGYGAGLEREKLPRNRLLEGEWGLHPLPIGRVLKPLSKHAGRMRCGDTHQWARPTARPRGA